MENTNNTIEEYEDALSLCDFALDGEEEEEKKNNPKTPKHHQNSSSSSSCHDHEDSFEFSIASKTRSVKKDINGNIIFCGKIIYCKKEDEDEDEDDDNKNYSNPLLCPSSPSPQLLNKYKSSSNKGYYYSSSKPSGLPLVPQGKSNSSSKNYIKAIIGLSRIPSQMELSDLRERQNRKQTPTPMFPAAVGGDTLGVSGGRSRNWRLLQVLASMLTISSSFSCLRVARPCFD